MNTQCVLGLGYSTHDVSAYLVHPEGVVGIARERLTRLKHDGGLNATSPQTWDLSNCIDYCLDAAGLHLDDVDTIIENHVLDPDFEEFHATVVARFARPYSVAKTMMISHHLAHAYSTYCASGFADALVMVADGVGNSVDAVRRYAGEDGEHLRASACGGVESHHRETFSLYSVRSGRFEVVRKDFGLASLGFAYRAVTTAIFGDPRAAGKTMGLAGYGRPGRCTLDLVQLDGGVLAFPYVTSLRELGLPRPPDEWPVNTNEWTDSHWARADLAWKMQTELESALVGLATWARQLTGHRRLCLAGGVALNSAANKKILGSAGFDDVFIVPAAADDGIAMGCAHWGICHSGTAARSRDRVRLRVASTGRSYSDTTIAEAVASDRRLVGSRLDEAALIVKTVEALLAEKTIGWFHGGSEMGPRALGNRSILGNPLKAATKTRLNSSVKFREGFRPFAPVIPLERAAEFFEIDRPSPFMLLVAPVRAAHRATIPAVTHVDGTARLQTVTAEDNRLLHAIATAFGTATGVPVILNTSLNVRGEPLVERPLEAVDCLLGTELDALAIEGWWVTKRELAPPELLDTTFEVRAGVAIAIHHLFQGKRRDVWARVSFATNRERFINVDSEMATLLLVLDDARTEFREVIGRLPAKPRGVAGWIDLLRSALRLNLIRARHGS
jgi:carbamoyltransferase